jgi:hypothetical protein
LYINNRTTPYIDKIARLKNDDLPKKFLGAWMHQPRKIGGPQLSYNNNFTRAISAVCLKFNLKTKAFYSKSGF